MNGKLFGPLRVDDCTWVIEEPDGVHEKFEVDDSESDSEEDTKKTSKRKVEVVVGQDLFFICSWQGAAHGNGQV